MRDVDTAVTMRTRAGTTLMNLVARTLRLSYSL